MSNIAILICVWLFIIAYWVVCAAFIYHNHKGER